MSAAPLHASSAPAPGTGKSFIWDVAAGIAVGDAMPIISVGGDLEELEKRLNTEILKGLTIFSIDNVSIPIGGDALCQAIERPSYKIRILSQSKGKDRLNTTLCEWNEPAGEGRCNSSDIVGQDGCEGGEPRESGV
jgi:hypothetical protein